MKNNCRTNSKKHCMACLHYDYCRKWTEVSVAGKPCLHMTEPMEHFTVQRYKANRCNGDCHLCDDYDCENNPKYKEKTKELITMEKKKIEFSELYTLCNKEEFFTCGDVNQYQKMFDLASSGVTHMELTYILYICSKYRLDYIYSKVAPLFNKGDN